MSSSHPRSVVRTSARVGTRKFSQLTAQGLRAGAFWIAVVLPFTYIPVLHGVGVDVFVALLALNVACAVAGHEYSPGQTTDTRT